MNEIIGFSILISIVLFLLTLNLIFKVGSKKE